MGASGCQSTTTMAAIASVLIRNRSESRGGPLGIRPRSGRHEHRPCEGTQPWGREQRRVLSLGKGSERRRDWSCSCGYYTGWPVEGECPQTVTRLSTVFLALPWAGKAITYWRSATWHSPQRSQVMWSATVAGQRSTVRPVSVFHERRVSVEGTTATAGRS